MNKISVSEIRARAVRRTLFGPVSLAEAIAKLRFVQIDPIKAPATAQDLCLRHRVKDYKEGDIDRAYSKLNIEEDVLYAYGYVTRDLWTRLRPAKTPPPTGFEKQVLTRIKKLGGHITADELDPYFGRETVRSDWGGQSRASKKALETLHRSGRLRIAGRKNNGIRVYELTTAERPEISAVDRFNYLAQVVTELLSPVDRKRIQAILSPLARSVFGPTLNRKMISEWLNNSLNNGYLVPADCEGFTYLWPAHAENDEEVPPSVRFLAPFDPLVWDRYRFEHIWGWQYRFEAYTPPAKRLRGYYAMPLLWTNEVIGWVNIDFTNGKLKVDPGFINKKPSSKLFKTEFENEMERFNRFIAP